jgi:hypothetical protein
LVADIGREPDINTASLQSFEATIELVHALD